MGGLAGLRGDGQEVTATDVGDGWKGGGWPQRAKMGLVGSGNSRRVNGGALWCIQTAAATDRKARVD